MSLLGGILISRVSFMVSKLFGLWRCVSSIWSALRTVPYKSRLAGERGSLNAMQREDDSRLRSARAQFHANASPSATVV